MNQYFQAGKHRLFIDHANEVYCTNYNYIGGNYYVIIKVLDIQQMIETCEECGYTLINNVISHAPNYCRNPIPRSDYQEYKECSQKGYVWDKAPSRKSDFQTYLETSKRGELKIWCMSFNN